MRAVWWGAWLAVGCAKAEVPEVSAASPVKLAEAAPPQVSFRFDPALGPASFRGSFELLMSLGTAQPSGVRLDMSWDEAVSRLPDGRVQTIVDVQRTTSLDVGVPTESQRAQARMVTAATPPQMVRITSADGAMVQTTPEAAENARVAVVAAVEAALPEGDPRDSAVAAVAGAMTQETVSEQMLSDWSTGAGFFLGATLDLDTYYKVQTQRRHQMAPDVPLTYDSTFWVEGPAPCAFGVTDQHCVWATVMSAPDPASHQALTEALFARMGSVDAPPDSVGLVERTWMLLEPDTLDVWWSATVRQSRMPGPEFPVHTWVRDVDERFGDHGPSQRPRASLTELRAAFRTTLRGDHVPGAAPEQAPRDSGFARVTYPAPLGDLHAYVTEDPGDGARHPAIVWLTGGDTQEISGPWGPANPANDQQATAYRDAGFTMMFPSQRGGHDNPGRPEGFLGEVDDVLAATAWLAAQPWVDPARIYLGGHSTGGTLALLVAASAAEDQYAGVVSFGPVDRPSAYGDRFVPANLDNPQEEALRAPWYWLHAIHAPTLVVEGEGGNVGSLDLLHARSDNLQLTFVAVPEHDHFTVLDPVNRVVAPALAAGQGLPLDAVRSIGR